MKKILLNTILFTFATLAIFSCSNNKTIFEETYTFSNEKWLRQETKTFNIKINNIDDCYDIFFNMKLDTTSVRGNNFPLIVNLYSDNGERRMFYSYLNLRNNEGTWLVPLEGSKLVIDQKIKEYFFFNTEGTYKLEVGQGTDRYEIKGVESFGVRIEKAQLIYPE